jgi:hypothetical protein
MRVVLPAALLATAALLAACSTGAGPLGEGGTAGQQCSPGAEGQPITMAIYDLHNTGSSPVKITGVGLPAAHGLTMTRSWLVPIYYPPSHPGQSLLIGAGWPYPPDSTAALASNPEWRNRVPAVGATIRPGQDLNLVFGLTRTTRKPGWSKGPLIAYSAGGSSYSVQEQTTLEIASGRSCP